MNPQDWYMQMLFRLDRIQSLINALKAFYDAPTEADTRAALSNLRRIEATPAP